MSLCGNIEDLSLTDILQIVSLSKRSGVLSLEGENKFGSIVIKDGRVVHAISSEIKENLGQILINRGLVTEDQLAEAVNIQKSKGMKERFGKIFEEMDLIDSATLEDVVKYQIKKATYDLLGWREGSFNFELCNISEKNDIGLDPQAVLLEQGIDTQWLVLEGARLMDEGGTGQEEAPSADKESMEGEYEEVVLKEEDEISEDETLKEKLEEGKGVIVVVDDVSADGELIRDTLKQNGFSVFLETMVDSALKKIENLLKKNISPIVLTDLVMPTSDSKGFLGGVEIVENISKNFPKAAVITMTAYPDAKVQQKVNQLGSQKFLLKPEMFKDKNGQPTSAFVNFINEIIASINHIFEKLDGTTPKKEEITDIQDQLMTKLKEEKAEIIEKEASAVIPEVDIYEFSTLKSMIDELHNPTATSEISLLILRFATELVNRAVLFLVKKEEIAGLGGFGLECGDYQKKGIKVQSIKIPLDESSTLQKIIQEKRSFKGGLSGEKWDQYLIDQLGGIAPNEILAIPIISRGRVIVLLYGDNVPESKPIPSTDILEIFISQAGLVMEKALLEKKLRDLESKM